MVTIPLTIALLTYNRGQNGYLRQALEAILGQTYGDFELLVLDNHSTDGTAELVLGYRDPRLTYVRQAPGGHAGTNYCSAFRMSRGRYVFAAHDDDVMEPTMVARQMAFLAAHPETVCVASNVSLIDERGQIIQGRLHDLSEDVVFGTGQYLPAYLLRQLWLPTPTLMIRRDTHVEDLGDNITGGDLAPAPWSDVLNTMRLNSHGPVAILADPLLRYRQHGEQESAQMTRSGLQSQLLAHLYTHETANPAFAPYVPAIRGAYYRGQARDCLLDSAESPNDALTARIRVMKEEWERVVAPEDRAVDVAVPFEITVCSLGIEPTFTAEGLRTLVASASGFGVGDGFRSWVVAAHAGRPLFCRRPTFRRVAIFGSLATAALLILEARRADVDVACCLDSNGQRIGRRLLGVPIVPHADLRRHAPVDAVVLSVERDADDLFKKLLGPHLPDPGVPIVSWKALAREAAAE
jgi:hypothetical protein